MSGSRNRATLAQTQFLNMGGVYAQPLAAMRDTGAIAGEGEYEYQEYPKMLRISQGIQEVAWSTETIKGKTLEGTKTMEVFEEIIVHSEEEEDRVLAGGKTSSQIEDERQDLMARCRNSGMRVDPKWTVTRLKRELGESLNAEPVNEMGVLEKKLADLQKMADMRAKIAALEAELAGAPSEHGEDAPRKPGRPRKIVPQEEAA